MGGRGPPHGAVENHIFGFRTFQNAGFPRFGLGLQKCCTELKTHFQGLKRIDSESMLLGRIPRWAAGDIPTAPWKIIFSGSVLSRSRMYAGDYSLFF